MARENTARVITTRLWIRLPVLSWTIGLVLFSSSISLADAGGAIAGHGDSPKACLDRADTYLVAREFDKAITEYTRVIQLKPDFAEAYNNRAYAFYSKYDGTGDPLSDLNRAIGLRPDFPHAYNTRGCVYMARGEAERAIADFNRAIQLEPNYPRAYRNRANAYLRKGRLGLAIADFERAGGNPKRIILYLSFAAALVLTVLGATIYRVFVRRSGARQKDAKPDGAPRESRWCRASPEDSD